MAGTAGEQADHRPEQEREEGPAGDVEASMVAHGRLIGGVVGKFGRDVRVGYRQSGDSTVVAKVVSRMQCRVGLKLHGDRGFRRTYR